MISLIYLYGEKDMTDTQEQTVQSEQPQPQQEQPQPQLQPMQFTAEQIQHIKMSLIERLQKQYLEFLSSVANLPCYKPGQLEAFKFFDTGFLWYKSAIENLVIAPTDPNAAQAPAPVPPQQPDAPEAA